MALLAVAQNGTANIKYGDGTSGPQNIPVAVLPRRDVFTAAGVEFVSVLHLDPSADLGTRPLAENDQIIVTARAGFSGTPTETYVLRNVDRPTAIPYLAILVCTAISGQ